MTFQALTQSPVLKWRIQLGNFQLTKRKQGHETCHEQIKSPNDQCVSDVLLTQAARYQLNVIYFYTKPEEALAAGCSEQLTDFLLFSSFFCLTLNLINEPHCNTYCCT